MTYLKYFLLTLIPFLILYNVHYNNKTEFEQDPNYMYLFNGLNLTTQPDKIATYTQGTTVVEISAVIMRATHLLRNTENSFSDDVLKNPQFYIKVVVRSFGLLISVILFLAGLFFLKMTNELIYGLLFQSVPAFSNTVTQWSFESFAAEPILLAGISIFVILILWRFYFNKSFGERNIYYQRNRVITIDKFPVIIGAVTGFCIATKMNILPIILVPFLLIPKIHYKFLFVLTSFLAYILFTLPVAGLYRLTIAWYLKMSSSDMFNIDNFITNLSFFLKNEIIISIVMIFSAFVLLVQTFRRKLDINYKILLIFFIVQFINIFMVLKLFDQYHFYYLIPLLPTFAINIFLILKLFKLNSFWKAAIVTPFIILCFFINSDFNKRIPGLYTTEYPQDGINIFSYKSTSPIYALKIADDNSRNANSKRLKEIYGDQVFYDIWYKIIITWTDTLSIDTLLKHNDKVYLHALDQYMGELPPPFGIDFISAGTYLVKNPYRNSSGTK